VQTTAELLRERADRILDEIGGLLDRSSIRHHNPSQGGVFYFGPTGSWGDLDTDARRSQSKILSDYERYFAILKVLLRGQPKNSAKELADTDGLIRKVIDQSEGTWHKNIDDARAKVHEAIEKQKELLDHLHDRGTGEVVLVPDTNALLHNVDLDTWGFVDTPTFELVLTPTVLVELDELKVNHRNEHVR
jgi:hypothetical protein